VTGSPRLSAAIALAVAGCAPSPGPHELPTAPGTLAYVVAYELGVPRAGFAVERLVALDASSGAGSNALAPVVLSKDGRSVELRLYALLFERDLAGLGLAPGLLVVDPNGGGSVLPQFSSAYLATATATSSGWERVATLDSVLSEVRIRPGP
jgi:hypothetical protein